MPQSRISLSIIPFMKALFTILSYSSLNSCMLSSGIRAYQFLFERISRHISQYLFVSITTTFPPLSAIFMVISLVFCNWLIACCCSKLILLSRRALKFDFLMSAVTWDKKVQILGVVFKWWNCVDFFPNLGLSIGDCAWGETSGWTYPGTPLCRAPNSSIILIQ